MIANHGYIIYIEHLSGTALIRGPRFGHATPVVASRDVDSAKKAAIVLWPFFVASRAVCRQARVDQIYRHHASAPFPKNRQ